MDDVNELIAKLENNRAFAANEAVIFTTETGRALARGRAYAYNRAITIVRAHFKIHEPPRIDECAEGGRY